MRVTTAALRTMDKKGGLDGYILGTRDQDLKSEFAIALKARLRAAKAAMERTATTETVVEIRRRALSARGATTARTARSRASTHTLAIPFSDLDVEQ